MCRTKVCCKAHCVTLCIVHNYWLLVNGFKLIWCNVLLVDRIHQGFMCINLTKCQKHPWDYFSISPSNLHERFQVNIDFDGLIFINVFLGFNHDIKFAIVVNGIEMCQFCQNHVFCKFFEGLTFKTPPPFSHVATCFLHQIFFWYKLCVNPHFLAKSSLVSVRIRNQDVLILPKLHVMWFSWRVSILETLPPPPIVFICCCM
jgi:hypothetical protein